MMRKKITKKYALVDFYENQFGDLIVASDDMKEIRKAARQFSKDTDGECLLFGFQWNDKTGSYERKCNL